MFEVGAKIDFWHFYVQSRSQNRSVTILNLYMGGGGELTVFPPRPMSRPLSRPLSRPTSRPTSRPLWESMPIFSIFSEILRILEKFMNRTSEKSAFPYWNLVHSSISLQFSPPAAKKAKTKRFYTPPLGRKKRQSLFPPKRIFWQEQSSFYVQSRSQNRCLTLLCSK